jgi:hypothetical protein
MRSSLACGLSACEIALGLLGLRQWVLVLGSQLELAGGDHVEHCAGALQ